MEQYKVTQESRKEGGIERGIEDGKEKRLRRRG